MTRRTPARPVDVEKLFPELIPFRRGAVRLHPRAGTPSCQDSSVGGPLLWPAAEPWPVCTEEHYDPDAVSELQGDVPMVPIVQVRQADAPGVPFPEGTDLLQVLWCPYAHGEYCYPLPRVHWRNTGAIGDILPTPAPVEGLPKDWYPDPCVVHPEQVTEYPDCEACGGRTEHLLTVASWEFDGESWRTWLPVEDRTGSGWAETADNPAGLCLGDAGSVYVFECRACPDRPVGHWFDCS